MISSLEETVEAQNSNLRATIASVETAMQAANVALENRINELNGELTALTEKVNSNSASITDNTGAIATLATLVNNAQAAIDALEAASVDKVALESLKDTMNSAIDTITDRVDALAEELKAVTDKLNINTNSINDIKSWYESIQRALNLAELAYGEVGVLKSNEASLNASVDLLQVAMNEAKQTIVAAEGRVTVLENKVATLETAKNNLENAIVNLQNAVDKKADSTTLNEKITELQAAITALEALKNDYVAADVELKADLEAIVVAAKEAAINSAQALVDIASAELQANIDAMHDALLQADSDNKAAMEAAIAEAEHSHRVTESISLAVGIISFVGMIAVTCYVLILKKKHIRG